MFHSNQFGMKSFAYTVTTDTIASYLVCILNKKYMILYFKHKINETVDFLTTNFNAI